MGNEQREHAGHSRAENIITELDAAIAALPSQNQYKDQRAAIEDSVWLDIYDSYQAGGFSTLEEAQDKFMQWRSCYQAAGRTALH